ncbi:mandelate racemase/muconate lactonizing enzyme family protein [Herbiconiux sp. 11R-BC]|uniref:mandelate racemase/muconate lactonizing enzyme family protein n=1 Tax=Herbiconiux sp. 11R-BC TaxID=3111637 RepID=UPI003C0B1104
MIDGSQSRTAGVQIARTEIFPINLPATPEQVAAGYYHRYCVVRMTTTEGVRGHSFAGPIDRTVWPAVVAATEGSSLTDIDGMLRRGLNRGAGAEHAAWDALGKTLGEPVHALLGGARMPELKGYVTLVWPGDPSQSHVSHAETVDAVLAYQAAGFEGVKIRCWREPGENARLCEAILAATGPEFTLMVDRTAHVSGSTWSYEQAVAEARELQDVGVRWLEEPLDRYDLSGQTRLADEIDMQIVGGEGYTTPAEFAAALVARSFDVIQPDASIANGILPTVRVAAMAEALGVPVCLHGTGGLRLPGWLQAAALIGPEWQELAIIPPTLHPDEAWSLNESVLRSAPWSIDRGRISVPTGPGLGIDVDDDALDRYRIG